MRRTSQHGCAHRLVHFPKPVVSLSVIASTSTLATPRSEHIENMCNSRPHNFMILGDPLISDRNRRLERGSSWSKLSRRPRSKLYNLTQAATLGTLH
jgi:hypothetical protein